MNHTHAKRVVLPIAALVALFVLFSVGIGVSASASRGPTAGAPCCQHQAPSQMAFPMRQPIVGQPCCEHQTPSQAAFSTSSSRLLAGTPCCEHYAPSQVAFQSSRTSGGVSVATTASSRGSTAAQAT